MSKHKFLFKHSVLYNSSKCWELGKWTESVESVESVNEGSSHEENQLRISSSAEQLEQVDQVSALELDHHPYNSPITHPQHVQVDEEDFPPDQSSNLTPLTPPILQAEHSSYLSIRPPLHHEYDQVNGALEVHFPSHHLGPPWTFQESTSTTLPQSDHPIPIPPLNPQLHTVITDHLRNDGEADHAWSVACSAHRSGQTCLNISQDEPEEACVGEGLKTGSVIKSSNRVGVITKTPSNSIKPPSDPPQHFPNTNPKDLPSQHHRSLPTDNIILHQSEGGVTYECKVCRKKFKSKNNCKYHIHGKDVTGFPYTCPHCGKGMFASTHYRYHLLTHSGERPYKCSLCSKGFLTSAKLERHRLIHSEEKAEKCGECSKTFHLTSELRRHERTHTEEQPYACLVCEKKFTIPSQLKNHELTHTGQHKYPCETCGKRFQRLKHLQNHKLIHVGTKPFRCEKCNKCFRTEASHSHHMKTHDDDRPYRCTTCGRGFVLQKDYNRHQNVHSGIAPFACTQCERTFRRKDNLIRHNKIYHLEGRRDQDGPPELVLS